MKFEYESKYEVGDWVYYWGQSFNLKTDKGFLSIYKTQITGIVLEDGDQLCPLFSNYTPLGLTIFYLCQTGDMRRTTLKFIEKSVFKTEKEAINDFSNRASGICKIGNIVNEKSKPIGDKVEEISKYELVYLGDENDTKID